jgi:hypothetical protein
LACIALAAPASASAHARSSTVALDYRLVLDTRSRSLTGASVSILDGDRSLRIRVFDGAAITVLGDLGEAMVRIGPGGALANRGSPTAAAERLVRPGKGWQRVGGSSFAWHDHRLAPPPYGDGSPGTVARFRIPIRVGASASAIGGAFVRYERPSLWLWLGGIGTAAAATVVLLRRLPRRRDAAVTGLGLVAAFAAISSLAAFGIADSPSGEVAWGQLVLAVFLGAALLAAYFRSRGARRRLVAELAGVAAVAASLGSLGVFRHGVVISAMPGALSRAVCALALAAGLAAAGAFFLTDGEAAA